MTPDKRVEMRIAELIICPISGADGVANYEYNMGYLDALESLAGTLTQYHQDLIEDILKMADALEMECGKDGDKGTKQWMAFKGFRNTIRDKYIIKSK